MKRLDELVKTVGVIALVLAAGAAGAFAAQASEEPVSPAGPMPGPAQELTFPDFVEKILDNGLRVVVVEHHEQPSVSLRLVASAGRIFEPADKSGLAAGVAALLTEGTESRSASAIAEAIDFVGGELDAGVGLDSAFASAAVTSDHLELGLELLADIVRRPVFAEEEIERWRKQTLSGLQVNLQDPGFVAGAALARLVFGGHPYGKPASGTPGSVAGITREDMVSFHRSHFLPNSSILAVVGAVEAKEALVRVEKYFGSWEGGAVPGLPEVDPPARDSMRLVVIDKPDAVQTQIRAGQVSLARKDPDYFTARVYDAVLGGSASARLFKEVREKRGLSYGARSSMETQRQPFLFLASTFTKTESTVESLEVVLEVVKGLGESPVPAAELAKRKESLVGAFPLQIETPDGIATRILDAKEHGYGRAYLETYRDRLGAVTAQQVRDFARRRIHADRFVVVLAGDASGFLQELTTAFGEPEVVALSDLDLLRDDLRRQEVEAMEISESDREAASVLLRAVREAHGGEVYQAQKSQISRGSGTLAAPGMPQPMPVESFVNYRVLPVQERVDISLPMGQMVQVFNGREGWSEMMGQIRDQTAQAREDKQYGIEVLRRFEEPGYLSWPEETVEVEGRSLEVVAVSDGDGHVTRLYVDPHSRLVARVAYEQPGRSVDAIYEDYRTVDGIQIPHRLSTVVDGSPMLELELSRVEIDVEVDPGLFEKPEE